MLVRLILCVCVLVASMTMASVAQTPPDRPTFRAGTTLVEFTLVATGGDGKPVTDLTQEEVAVAVGGRSHEVAFFHYEGAPPSAIRVTSLPPGIFTNRPEYAPGAPRNIIAIVIDALNTRPEDQVRVLGYIMSFVAAVPGDTRIAIYRTGERVHVVHDFTDDINGLRVRLAKGGVAASRDTQAGVEVEQPIIEQWQADAMSATMEASMELAYQELARVDEQSNQQILTRRHDYTMASLEAVGNHLAGIPGRKSMVWMTAGVPMMSMGTRDPWPVSYQAPMRALAQKLASQGIAIYPVEAAGVRSPYLNVNAGAKGSTRGVEDSVAAATAGDALNRAAVRVEARAAARGQPMNLSALSTSPDAQRSWSGMDLFADLTGGRVMRNTNDMLAGIKAATDDLRGTYSVGFYAPQESDNRWQTFTVKVRRPDVKVVHRQGFLSSAASKQSELWLAEQWRAAANNPLGSASVRLDARFELKDNVLSAVLQIPAEDLEFRRVKDAPTSEIEVALAERSPQGLVRIGKELGTFALQESQAADVSQVTLRFRKQWTLDPKTTLMRIVIRDQYTGRYGTLDVPVDALR